jgi:hypothetical protein
MAARLLEKNLLITVRYVQDVDAIFKNMGLKRVNIEDEAALTTTDETVKRCFLY